MLPEFARNVGLKGAFELLWTFLAVTSFVVVANLSIAPPNQTCFGIVTATCEWLSGAHPVLSIITNPSLERLYASITHQNLIAVSFHFAIEFD